MGFSISGHRGLRGECHHRSADELARRACEIEIDVLGRPIGKQDQYIAAYGGFRFIDFNQDDSVSVNSIISPPEYRSALLGRLMLFYTGITRDASSVLQDAKRRLNESQDTRNAVSGLVELAFKMRDAFTNGRINRLGPLFLAGWELKKQMSPAVTTGVLNGYYSRAIRAGAGGGKISGAGGGGCLLLYVPPGKRSQVRSRLKGAGLTEITFGCEPEGSRILYYDHERTPGPRD